MPRPLPALAIALLAALPTLPDAAADTFSVSLSRHHTTNALDAPLALADWYTLLRGGLDHTVTHDLGSTRIVAEGELRRFDTYAIENDVSAGISAATTTRVSEALELRGTLSLGMVSEGDDFPVGGVVLGMRTRTVTVGGTLQAGFKLSPDTVLVVEGAATHERPSQTRFEAGLLPPLRLEAQRERLRLAAKLTRTRGAFSYGIAGAAGLKHAQPTALLPELRVSDYGGQLHAALKLENGATLSASGGAELMRLIGLPFRQIRPAWEIAAAAPLPAGFSLRGSFRGGYDFATRDDPLAVWVRRHEVEASWQPAKPIMLGSGVYFERRDAVGLRMRERRRGLYAQATWQPREQVEVTLRVDATKKSFESLDAEHRAVDVQLAISTRL